MKGMIPGAVVLLLGALGGCDSGGDSGASGSNPETEETTEYLEWQPAGTFPVPVYGVSCRLRAGTVYEPGSNGSADDTVALELAPDGSGVLHLRVLGAEGEVLVANNITMERGKKNESFRHANSDPLTPITWGDGLTLQGTAVAGSLCFSDRLSTGVQVDAQFSLILATGDGLYHTVGGSFSVPSGVVSNDGISEIAVDVDLR